MSERAREGLGGTRRTPPRCTRKPGPTTGTGLHAGALGTGSVSAQFSSRTTGALTAALGRNRYFFSLRYSKTWSMMPYSLACSAVRILSRSVSRRTCSAV